MACFSLSYFYVPTSSRFTIVDTTAWHTSKKLHIAENITLIELPAYSPQLNPAEKVGQSLKEYYLCHTLVNNYDRLCELACIAWQKLNAQNALISSLTSFPYLSQIV